MTSRRPAAPRTLEGYYREALALADELGMRPLVAHCHLGLGKLYARTGKREQAQEHLTTATAMYREMDMRFWLEQAEAELRVNHELHDNAEQPALWRAHSGRRPASSSCPGCSS